MYPKILKTSIVILIIVHDHYHNNEHHDRQLIQQCNFYFYLNPPSSSPIISTVDQYTMNTTDPQFMVKFALLNAAFVHD